MPLTRTVKVQVRHSLDCKDRHKGVDWKRCRCPKILRVYEGGGSGANRRIATKTRSWEEAEKQAQELRDSWDPVKQELSRLKAAQETKQVTIERAVVLYTADMDARKVAPGTVAMARSLLGHVDPKTHDVTNPGHLFGWLARIPVATRPVYIADLTTASLTEWRGAWRFEDYTAAQRWGMVKSFFNFCVAQGWIQDNPARKLRRIEYKPGSRTAIFDDKQYDAILEAVASYEPENVPHVTRATWQQRVMTFLELLRWSGMALIDGVQYGPGLVDDEGVLRYKRQKTGELATVQLPDRLLALLRSVPLERNSVGPGQPFRMKDFTPHSDTVTWRKRLQRLFTLAGIMEVRNELGKARPAHPHMLRDTFAVWNLRHGVPLHAVSKMLGHRNPVTTAKAYLPFVKELEKATIAEGRAALKNAEPKPAGRKVVTLTKR
jgi:integrase